MKDLKSTSGSKYPSVLSLRKQGKGLLLEVGHTHNLYMSRVVGTVNTPPRKDEPTE